MSSDDVARRAALRLGDELDRQLPAMVEAQLQGGGEPPSVMSRRLRSLSPRSFSAQQKIRLGYLSRPQERFQMLPTAEADCPADPAGTQ